MHRFALDMTQWKFSKVWAKVTSPTAVRPPNATQHCSMQTEAGSFVKDA